MVWLRCPQCTHAFRAAASQVQVCPACGHRGWIPDHDPHDVTSSKHYRPRPRGVHGKPRRFWGFLGLNLVTLLGYSLLWYGRVFKELDDQHERKPPRHFYALMVLTGIFLYLGAVAEVLLWVFDVDLLADPDKDLLTHVALWGTVGLLFLLFSILHVVPAIGRLHDYRRARDLPRGLGAGGFYIAVASGLLFMGGLVASGLLNNAIKEVWFKIYEEQGADLPEWARPVDEPDYAV